MTILPGLTADISVVVSERDTAASYGSGLVPVLSTPHLVALMENAAQKVLSPYLAAGESAVGVSIEMRHLAATPIGMEVRVHAEVTSVDGRKIGFKIEAWDEVEKIGEAEHTRFIIDEVRFMRRVAAKASAKPSPSPSDPA